MNSKHPLQKPLDAARLRGMRRGIEKESLRTLPGGQLALSPHASALGSALTHPHLTTDFSESQIEIVTGAHTSVSACLEELQDLHRFVYRAIQPERLWVDSMPGRLPPDAEIPLGQYGTSPIGRAKTVYRMGLGHRYGRRMQTISGIHYNWSIPEASDADYFALIRNFRRHSFLLLTLFGASPAVDADFVRDQDHGLLPLGDHSLYLPHATSLRMGRLGYQSDAQSALCVSYNDLEGYAASLQEALSRPYPAYEAIGVGDDSSGYRQLATTLLQIENEFYGTIRPKRTIERGERPLHALRHRGVEYVEVRCMDLDPFEPAGIGARTARFIDVFLLHCLLSDSPPDTPAEIAALGRNQHRTAARGREPGLKLERGSDEVLLTDWGQQLLAECMPIARAMDEALGGQAHQEAVAAAQQALRDPEQLPSARVLQTMQSRHADSFVDFVDQRAATAQEIFLAQPLTAERQAELDRMAADSWRAQQALEAEPDQNFERFRQRYTSVDRPG